jgi:hypothetical protein
MGDPNIVYTHSHNHTIKSVSIASCGNPFSDKKSIDSLRTMYVNNGLGDIKINIVYKG